MWWGNCKYSQNIRAITLLLPALLTNIRLLHAREKFLSITSTLLQTNSVDWQELAWTVQISMIRVVIFTNALCTYMWRYLMLCLVVKYEPSLTILEFLWRMWRQSEEDCWRWDRDWGGQTRKLSQQRTQDTVALLLLLDTVFCIVENTQEEVGRVGLVWQNTK